MNAAVFQERNEAIHQTKLKFNDEKIVMKGTYDNDDHGWIPLPPFEYTRFKDAASGLTTGMDAVSRTFCAWLDAHPVYIHPYSAIAGAWTGTVGFDSWRPEHRMDDREEVFKLYNITGRVQYAMNHSAPDMQIGLELGWGGLLEKIRRYRDKNRPQVTDFYDGEERFVEAIQRWIRRHVEYARGLAASDPDAFVRKNMGDIADMNEWLVDNPPRTLREAVQFIGWFQSVDRMYYLGGALQELDELLRPYYEADKAAGRLEGGDEEAIWYIVSLLFNDTHYSQIGGQHPVDGHDMSSPMSFIILEAMHRLRIPINMALRLHENTNDELFTRCVQYLFEDGTGVSYACSEGLDKGYMRNGQPVSTARMRAKVGCNWTALPGIEYCLQDVHRYCLSKPLLLALDDMIASDEPASMEHLLRRYEEHMKVGINLIKDGIDWHVKYKWLNRPEIVLNLFAHGPIERGIDMSAGGVDIMYFTSDGVGLATVANSLAAMEQRIVKEGALSWEGLQAALKANWEGFEDIRMSLKSVPQYGSGGSRADDYALLVSKLFTGLVRGTPTPGGFPVIPGLFSHGVVYAIGKNLPATPNGRFDGDPISHSADPDPGFMEGGTSAPTAKANAVARVQCGWGNTTPLQIDLDAGLAKEFGGIDIIKNFLMAHNNMGGTLVNINVVSKEKLLDAHENPDKYPDLVVRVTGYSAFFKSLSKEYRQQIVDRWVGE
ncbi:MAG: pyruvate-formate lyase [Oscillospiraceae bacterium]|nr:pyruvate-formate lyase [Oscillospiraceae bacterium]